MSTVRHILSMRSPRGERGAAAIMVAISLLMLLGVTALAIDGSSAYNDRRGSQNAADNAALAAAWQQCNPDTIGSTPENAARATAADNGYDDKNPDVTVTPTQVSAGVWEVKITKLQDGIFGQATPYAPDALTVVSQAVAECVVQEYLGNYALFAAAYGCSGDEISVTSSNIDVTGGVFSNEQITISGGGPGVTGDIINRDPSGGSDGTYDKGPPQKYPVDLDITDFRPGGTESSDPNYHAASGNIDSNWLVNNGYATMVSGTPNLTVSGIYYSPGSITLIKGLTTNPGVKATFVGAEGHPDATEGDPHRLCQRGQRRLLSVGPLRQRPGITVVQPDGHKVRHQRDQGHNRAHLRSQRGGGYVRVYHRGQRLDSRLPHQRLDLVSHRDLAGRPRRSRRLRGQSPRVGSTPAESPCSGRSLQRLQMHAADQNPADGLTRFARWWDTAPAG